MEGQVSVDWNRYWFVIRLKNYLAKWLELSGSSPRNFDAFADLIVKEQFINA